MIKKIQIYNPKNRKLEEFNSIVENKINIYVCGPTVYDHIHLGNARPIIFFDFVKKFFEDLNYEVNLVSNITDIDDKIINRSIEEQISEKEISEKYTKEYINSLDYLRCRRPDLIPKATDYVDSMINFIQELKTNNYVYETKQGLYFRINSVDYGVLSNQKVDRLISKKNQDFEKENERDFSVWKKTELGLKFDSPWGEGRPGWHTECAVMNHKIFNGQLDIHGGGNDLKFPHHENEIALIKAFTGKKLSNYWIHNGRLDFNNVKMSKSKKNFVRVADLPKEKVDAFKFLILSHHYRSPINYSEKLLNEYDKILQNISKKIRYATLKMSKKRDKFLKKFDKAPVLDMISKDFDTPNIVTRVYNIIKKIDIEENYFSVFHELIWIFHLFGIRLNTEVPRKDISLYEEWVEAREKKDYETADRLRNKLMGKGYL